MKCSICGREVPENYQERHHLEPGNKKSELIDVCIDCGDQVHQLFTEKELRDSYNTLDKLLSAESVQKWVRWIRKKSEFGFCMKSKKRK